MAAGAILRDRHVPRGDDLIPLDVTDDKDSRDAERHRPKAMRLMTERYLGVLRDDKTLELLDLDNGGATSAKLTLQTKTHLESFCASSDHMYLLGSGSHPSLLRVPLRAAFAG
ncbi:fumA [Symbiodinium natans]|uniref:FumA protein n=1 Tax=Symbiodinium natans TaxID=878477 RepID=A0A812KJ40_9DINO|nr:fumA [Symbiodinium natans]